MCGADDLNWLQLISRSSSMAASGDRKSLSRQSANGAWVAVQLSEEYLLALLAEAAVPPGRVRFLACEWAAARREEFA